MVFSTYVEMIPNHAVTQMEHLRVLHVCGDDPCSGVACFCNSWCSPRMWR